tara:strand:+ start:16364 stop:19003 length:2640 start_codon:yes stop_codon:yes gene_type:complete
MKSNEIREKFLNYFAKHGHTRVPSSSLIPSGDSTLIFTNAGMFQFKNVFLGVDKRDYQRAASSQKCVRAGGKHNDLENVGYTARHHTFFEMLGNFSFGDYFKKDAIRYAWDFLTNECQIPKDRLYVTVFEEDDEAADLWHQQEGVPKDRIFRFGEKDNFWRMGDTGPCGPCSEIFYDHYPEKGKVSSKEEFEKGGEEDRFVEIWNLVFMQFYEEPKGQLSPLPKPSVDTGMGLERLAAVLQGEHNNYNSDLFFDYIEQLEKWTGKKAEAEALVAMRVLADHSRCVSFLIADGVLPSNDGRGYVLRRIIRRAIRFARQISNESLLPRLCQAVIDKMSEAYPELKQKQEVILHTIEGEEERFLKTLDQGTQLLMEEMAKAKAKVLSGEVVFKLYDTYGFPLDLTQLIAREKGFQVDESGFEKQMQAAKERARKTWKGATMDSDQAHLLKMAQKYGATKFVGYENTANTSKVLALSDGKQEISEAQEGQKIYLLADETCFYAESGGQVGDVGTMEGEGFSAIVSDCIKVEDTHFLVVHVEQGVLRTGAEVRMLVQASERRATASNHSATHLLHAALREVLGDHVTQAGSLVDSQRLRFDFTHNHAMSDAEIQRVEMLVNKEISLGRKVEAKEMTYDQAMQSGAMALFGEKYGDQVRVIQMGDFSTELCGGTHVASTSDIRILKIMSEAGVSAGVRRMEAITGDKALDYLLKAESGNRELRKTLGIKESWENYLESSGANQQAVDAVEQLRESLKAQTKKVKALQMEQVDYAQIVSSSPEIGGKKVICFHMDIEDRKLMAEMAQRFLDHCQQPAVVILSGESESNYPLLVAVSKDLSKSLKAGDVLKSLTAVMGGKGGGRPDLAQGALDKIENLAQEAEKILI